MVARRVVALSAITEASQIDPLHWSELGDFDHESGFWSVVRFEDIAAVGRDRGPDGEGGRHFCHGAGLARLELKLWIEETLRRFSSVELDGDCERVSSTFLNQYATMPVQLS